MVCESPGLILETFLPVIGPPKSSPYFWGPIISRNKNLGKKPNTFLLECKVFEQIVLIEWYGMMWFLRFFEKLWPGYGNAARQVGMAHHVIPLSCVGSGICAYKFIGLGEKITLC